jgi:hypothetical protein
MSAAADQANFPTMIIPRGTEIRVNQSGQLSIKTPGNLVIQNSGVYSEIESTNGSIRIEENVTVEAVSIRAGQACFIQGTLTAWRVHAKQILLEDRARAFIMLQESERLELAKSARLVGNFASEKELFFMMGKFSPQLKELPGTVDMSSTRELGDRPTTMKIPSMPSAAMMPGTDDDRLKSAQSLLEREVLRTDLSSAEVDALREVLFSLRDRNMQRVSMIWRDAIAEVKSQSENLRTVTEQLDSYFAAR